MNLRKRSAALLAAALFTLPLAAMSETSTDTDASSTSRLIAQYTSLAGSQQNATSLVDGLRSGSQVTLTSASGQTTTFTPATGKMGYGEVNISLALAEKLMTTNPNLTLSGALMGTSSTQGILQMRASGMGWGQIANSLGFRLGDVMRSAKADAATQRASTERAEHPARMERPERPQLPDRPERPGR